MNKMSSNTKRNPPYVKKEDKKKTEAKNKLKGTIVIHALPMNIPDFRGKDTLMHDSFGGEPPKFVVNKPRMAVDYMKPEHSITPKSKPAKSQPPLKELNKLVENIKTEPTTEKTKVEVLEQGEIPQDSGTGTYQYSSLDELLDSVDVSYPCPIHQTIVDGLKSKREDCDDVLLRCSIASYPVFCNPNDYHHYYYKCQRQGHSWFTLDRIYKMVCECGMTPTLSLTQSETNYGKMYLQCSQRYCKLFTWWQFKPNKRTVQILTDGCE